MAARDTRVEQVHARHMDVQLAVGHVLGRYVVESVEASLVPRVAHLLRHVLEGKREGFAAVR
jgi:hypothetical protein